MLSSARIYHRDCSVPCAVACSTDGDAAGDDYYNKDDDDDAVQCMCVVCVNYYGRMPLN